MVVSSGVSGFEWLGLHWLQSWFCFVWSETRGVVETVIMMIEVIRKMLFLEPSQLLLHVYPFCSLYKESSIPDRIDGCMETEGKQRVPSAWSAILWSISMSFAFCHRIRSGSEHEIFLEKAAKETVVAGRTALNTPALHRGSPEMTEFCPSMQTCRWPSELESPKNWFRWHVCYLELLRWKRQVTENYTTMITILLVILLEKQTLWADRAFL